MKRNKGNIIKELRLVKGKKSNQGGACKYLFCLLGTLLEKGCGIKKAAMPPGITQIQIAI